MMENAGWRKRVMAGQSNKGFDFLKNKGLPDLHPICCTQRGRENLFKEPRVTITSGVVAIQLSLPIEAVGNNLTNLNR